MNKRSLTIIGLSCAIAMSVACAADTPPTEASIKQLLELTNARKLLDTMMSQIDTIMKTAMDQAIQGQSVPSEVKNQIDQFEAEMKVATKEMLDWDKLEPMYVRIYQKSLTQQDVDGMIAFYKTPSGQALINKMPLVMQNTMAEMQQMMQPMMERIRQMQETVIAEIQAKNKKSGG